MLIYFSSTSIPLPQLQVNCVVMRGTNEDELCDFVALTENKVSHDGSYQSYSNYSGQTGIGKQFRS